MAPREFPGLVSNRQATLSSHTSHGDHGDAEASLEPPHADDPPLANGLSDTPLPGWILPLPLVTRPSCRLLSRSPHRRCVFALFPKTDQELNDSSSYLVADSPAKNLYSSLRTPPAPATPSGLGRSQRKPNDNSAASAPSVVKNLFCRGVIVYSPARFS